MNVVCLLLWVHWKRSSKKIRNNHSQCTKRRSARVMKYYHEGLDWDLALVYVTMGSWFQLGQFCGESRLISLFFSFFVVVHLWKFRILKILLFDMTSLCSNLFFVQTSVFRFCFVLCYKCFESQYILIIIGWQITRVIEFESRLSRYHFGFWFSRRRCGGK